MPANLGIDSVANMHISVATAASECTQDIRNLVDEQQVFGTAVRVCCPQVKAPQPTLHKNVYGSIDWVNIHLCSISQASTELLWKESLACHIQRPFIATAVYGDVQVSAQCLALTRLWPHGEGPEVLSASFHRCPSVLQVTPSTIDNPTSCDTNFWSILHCLYQHSFKNSEAR